VKDSGTNYFNLDLANSVPYYTVINKTGNNIAIPLNAASRDIDGALIQSGTNYRVYILSVGVSQAFGNALSAPSPVIKLNNGGTVTSATNVTGTDIGDNNNGLDLRVSFTKAAVETNIMQYRIFVVPDALSYAFNISTANLITDQSRYTTAYIGSNYSQSLGADARDIYGQQIQNGMPYRIFVLSVGNTPGVNSLSLASPVVTLTAGNVQASPGVSAYDIGDQRNGADLKATFVKASDESNVNHYRVFVVRENQASSFTCEYRDEHRS